MLTHKIKRNIARVVPYGVLWFIFGLIYSLLEKSILGNLKFYPATGVSYSFMGNLIVVPVAGMLMGLITGTMEVIFFGKWFIKKSFTRKILFKSLIYLLVVIGFLIVITMINMLYLHDISALTDFSSPDWGFFRDYALLGVMLYMASIVVIVQFYAEVSQNIGPGTLRNFFLGKYHHPVEEQRIFMFLDMKSSTTIAEALGHVSYFEMLKEYFFDLSGAVIDHVGEIYQYAGDEMIISWKLDSGLKNNNSIECFFAMKALLASKAQNYNNRFGILPDFKAGLHYGMVTAGEIGSLKKEIVFTGDVLNTTARIQGLCNQNQRDLLVSKDLIGLLQLPSNYNITSIGQNILKGRAKPIEIFTVSKT